MALEVVALSVFLEAPPLGLALALALALRSLASTAAFLLTGSHLFVECMRMPSPASRHSWHAPFGATPLAPGILLALTCTRGADALPVASSFSLFRIFALFSRWMIFLLASVSLRLSSSARRLPFSVAKATAACSSAYGTSVLASASLCLRRLNVLGHSFVSMPCTSLRRSSRLMLRVRASQLV